MDKLKKFESFLDRMQGLLDNAKKQGHIIVRVEDLENAFPELTEEESNEKPNGGIVMENFDEGDGFYKVNLAYLNKEQVGEIEELVKKWNPELAESEDERIRKGLIAIITDFESLSLQKNYLLSREDILAWLEKQGEHSVSHLFTFEDVLTIQCAMAYAKFQDRELDVALKKLHDKVYDAYHDSKNHHIESQDGLKGEQKPVDIVAILKDYFANTPKEQQDKDLEELKHLNNFGWELIEQKSTDKVEPKFKVGDIIERKHNSDINKFGHFTITDIFENCYWYNDAIICDISEQDEWEISKFKTNFDFKVGQWIVATGKCIYCITKIDGFNVTLVDVDNNEYVFDVSSLNDTRLWTIQDAKDGDVLSYRDGQWIYIYKEKIDDSSFDYHILYSTIHQDLTIDDSGFTLLSDAIIPATKEQRDTLMKAMTDKGYTFDFEKKELKEIEQNPAWSEEDDEMVQVAINACNSYQDSLVRNDSRFDKAVKAEDWLKDLKYRVQPQTTWKPSEEQINWLIWAINRVPNEAEAVLRDLLEQLNKLREE